MRKGSGISLTRESSAAHHRYTNGGDSFTPRLQFSEWFRKRGLRLQIGGYAPVRWSASVGIPNDFFAKEVVVGTRVALCMLNSDVISIKRMIKLRSREPQKFRCNEVFSHL